jgi:enolase
MSDIVIKTIHAHEVLNATGNPTLELELFFSNGHHIRTVVPSADTKNIDPRVNELRDQDPMRFNGLGLQKAATIINSQIAGRLVNHLPYKQQDFDTWLLDVDGTENHSKLGINTINALSWMMARAGAYVQGIPLFYYINRLYNSFAPKKPVELTRIPTPQYCLINGGQHGGDLDFEEFYFIPSSTIPFASSFQTAVEMFQELEDVCKTKNLERTFSTRGGYILRNITNLEALDLINDLVVQKNLKVGLEAFYGIRCNAQHYYANNRYTIKDRGGAIKSDEYFKWVQQFCEKYSLLCIEDVFQKDDWDSWRRLYAQIAEQTYVLAHDLSARGLENGRIEEIAREKAATTISVEPYILGTLSDGLKKAAYIREQGLGVSLLPQTEETGDDFLADFAVGIQAEFIQFGGFMHTQLNAKYNRLWHIDRFELRTKKPDSSSEEKK